MCAVIIRKYYLLTKIGSLTTRVLYSGSNGPWGYSGERYWDWDTFKFKMKHDILFKMRNMNMVLPHVTTEALLECVGLLATWSTASKQALLLHSLLMSKVIDNKLNSWVKFVLNYILLIWSHFSVLDPMVSHHFGQGHCVELVHFLLWWCPCLNQKSPLVNTKNVLAI